MEIKNKRRQQKHSSSTFFKCSLEMTTLFFLEEKILFQDLIAPFIMEFLSY